MDTVEYQPCTSIQAVGSILLVPQSTSWKVMKGCTPTIFKPVQALIAADYPFRIDLASWVLQHIAVRLHFTATVFFTDEYTFKHYGAFITHNEQVWPNVNPHVAYPHVHQQRFSIIFWWGIIVNDLAVPYLLPEFFAVRIYLTILPDMLRDLSTVIRRHMWFQHDGAAAHYVREMRHYLDVTLLDRRIWRGGPIASPLWLPDLLCLNFFLWGYRKSLICANPLES